MPRVAQPAMSRADGEPVLHSPHQDLKQGWSDDAALEFTDYRHSPISKQEMISPGDQPVLFDQSQRVASERVVRQPSGNHVLPSSATWREPHQTQPPPPKRAAHQRRILSNMNVSVPQNVPTANQYKIGDYILSQVLGVGSFGKVKLATHELTGERFACKILDKSVVRERTLSLQVRKEITVMERLKHPNIVGLSKVYNTKDKIYIIMELVTGGELFEEIIRHKRLDENQARFYFRQLIRGLMHCHARGIYHRDLKPENLLLDGNKQLKISDFGLSTLKSPPGGSSMSSSGYGGAQSATSVSGSSLLHTQCGTPNYVAPEIIMLDKRGYSGAKVDAWSCGIILYVLVAGALPFDADEMDVLFKLILLGDISYPSHFSPELIDLIAHLLITDPKRRYRLSDATKHPWMTAVNDDFVGTVLDSGAKDSHNVVGSSEVLNCSGIACVRESEIGLADTPGDTLVDNCKELRDLGSNSSDSDQSSRHHGTDSHHTSSTSPSPSNVSNADCTEHSNAINETRHRAATIDSLDFGTRAQSVCNTSSCRPFCNDMSCSSIDKCGQSSSTNVSNELQRSDLDRDVSRACSGTSLQNLGMPVDRTESAPLSDSRKNVKLREEEYLGICEPRAVEFSSYSVANVEQTEPEAGREDHILTEAVSFARSSRESSASASNVDCIRVHTDSGCCDGAIESSSPSTSEKSKFDGPAMLLADPSLPVSAAPDSLAASCFSGNSNDETDITGVPSRNDGNVALDPPKGASTNDKDVYPYVNPLPESHRDVSSSSSSSSSCAASHPDEHGTGQHGRRHHDVILDEIGSLDSPGMDHILPANEIKIIQPVKTCGIENAAASLPVHEPAVSSCRAPHYFLKFKAHSHDGASMVKQLGRLPHPREHSLLNEIRGHRRMLSSPLAKQPITNESFINVNRTDASAVAHHEDRTVSDSDEIPWHFKMKDFDINPDESEFGMGSAALDEQWSRRLRETDPAHSDISSPSTQRSETYKFKKTAGGGNAVRYGSVAQAWDLKKREPVIHTLSDTDFESDRVALPWSPLMSLMSETHRGRALSSSRGESSSYSSPLRSASVDSSDDEEFRKNAALQYAEEAAVEARRAATAAARAKVTATRAAHRAFAAAQTVEAIASASRSFPHDVSSVMLNAQNGLHPDSTALLSVSHSTSGTNHGDMCAASKPSRHDAVRLNRSGASFRSSLRHVVVNGDIVGGNSSTSVAKRTSSPTPPNPPSLTSSRGNLRASGVAAYSVERNNTITQTDSISVVTEMTSGQNRVDGRSMLTADSESQRRNLSIASGNNEKCSRSHKYGNSGRDVFTSSSDSFELPKWGHDATKYSSESASAKNGDNSEMPSSGTRPASTANRVVTFADSPSPLEFQDGTENDFGKSLPDSSELPKKDSASSTGTEFARSAIELSAGCGGEHIQQEDPFKINIPGPSIGLVRPPPRSKLLASLHIGGGSKRKQRAVAESVQSQKRLTRFYSLQDPQWCCKTLETALDMRGCTQIRVTKSASSSALYKIRCVKVADKQPTVACIDIARHGDVTAVSFKKKSSVDSNRFILFYDDIYKLYCRLSAGETSRNAHTVDIEGVGAGEYALQSAAVSSPCNSDERSSDRASANTAEKFRPRLRLRAALSQGTHRMKAENTLLPKL